MTANPFSGEGIHKVELELKPGGGSRVVVDGKELQDQVTDVWVRATAGHLPEIELTVPAAPLVATIEGIVTITDTAAKLQEIREFHELWGEKDGDELDVLALWEDLGRILGSVS